MAVFEQYLYENQDSDDEESEDSVFEDEPWISWFCNLRGNEFFCEVEEAYITDDFNLTGLNSVVPFYEEALDIILDADRQQSQYELYTTEEMEQFEASSELLYGLIHARYILTSKGLDAMKAKLQRAEFGRCPRVLCAGQPCLPVGQTNAPGVDTVKIFCPRCQDIYYPRSSRHGHIDGAYFGSTFPHLFLLSFNKTLSLQPVMLATPKKYEPRIYGFRINETAGLYRQLARGEAAPALEDGGAPSLADEGAEEDEEEPEEDEAGGKRKAAATKQREK